jgi:hypothetical protein
MVTDACEILYYALINYYCYYYKHKSLALLLNLLKSILWINRRNEKDVIDLYNSLAPFAQIALADANNTMLNFGYWTPDTNIPIEAQVELCRVVGEFADLQSATPAKIKEHEPKAVRRDPRPMPGQTLSKIIGFRLVHPF